MKQHTKSAWAAACILLSMACQGQSLPMAISKQFPKWLEPLAYVSADFNHDGLTDYVVVLRDKAEKHWSDQTRDDKPAPLRPLLIFFGNKDASFNLIARNDEVVFAMDAGPCDPFEPFKPFGGPNGLAVKGAFLTIENEMACRDHWTDYITFKYVDQLQNFVFHKRIYENWEMNRSHDPNAEALVLAQRVVKSGKKSKPVSLSDYVSSPGW